MTASLRTQQLDAIAWLVSTIRPDWGRPGVRAQLDRLPDADPGDLAVVAITAAITRRDQRTPAVIAMGGDHWAHLPSGTRPGIPMRRWQPPAPADGPIPDPARVAQLATAARQRLQQPQPDQLPTPASERPANDHTA